MNDQIRDRLIKQAGFHVRPSVENTVGGIDWHSGSWGYDQCLDRLIELIVRECADLSFEHWAVTHDTSPQEAILNHFGIE